MDTIKTSILGRLGFHSTDKDWANYKLCYDRDNIPGTMTCIFSALNPYPFYDVVMDFDPDMFGDDLEDLATTPLSGDEWADLIDKLDFE